MSKWAGKKAGGSHTTVIEAAIPLVKMADGLSQVKRVSPGFITPTPGKHGDWRVRFTGIKGGLLAKVRGNTAVQEIWIYTNDPDLVAVLLSAIYVQDEGRARPRPRTPPLKSHLPKTLYPTHSMEIRGFLFVTVASKVAGAMVF